MFEKTHIKIQNSRKRAFFSQIKPGTWFFIAQSNLYFLKIDTQFDSNNLFNSIDIINARLFFIHSDALVEPLPSIEINAI